MLGLCIVNLKVRSRTFCSEGYYENDVCHPRPISTYSCCIWEGESFEVFHEGGTRISFFVDFMWCCRAVVAAVSRLYLSVEGRFLDWQRRINTFRLFWSPPLGFFELGVFL